jgi:adenylate kinase
VAKHGLVQLSTGDMLRGAVKAGTQVGLRARDIMARGELVPDDVVVAIVSARIDEPDARNGFILDGFPRTVPQAHALDRLLREKGLKLDAVIDLKVDEEILLERIKKRIAETRARGETLRADDDPEVLRRRLLAFRDQTAPLVAYYQLQSVLRQVDGMAAVTDVARAIDDALRRTTASDPDQGLRDGGRVSPPSRGNGKDGVENKKAKSRKPRTGAVRDRSAGGPAPAGTASRKTPSRKNKRRRRLTKRG